ncbi:YdcF family protein [Phreatobacter aquaticus]|nr:YdcF family protein [Phreatobacter aquaticus]
MSLPRTSATLGVAPDHPPAAGQPRRARWRLRSIMLLLTASAVGLAAGFPIFARSATRGPDLAGLQTEAIVAMTGGSSRISDAVGLLGTGHGRRLLISGVNPMVGEREIARVVPAAAAMMRCCIDLDHRALNTVGNAMETARWVRLHAFKSVLVVTSGYHMPRTMLELQRVLPDVQLVAYPVPSGAVKTTAWWKDIPSLKILSFEYAKYLLAAVRLRLDPPTADLRPVRSASR